jgi:hypothetical protein
VYWETLADYGDTCADHTVLICSDCVAALRKGSYRSPALQNIALLHNRMFMDVGAAPQYLHVTGMAIKAEGVDNLAAQARRASESTVALRQIVPAEAEQSRAPGRPTSSRFTSLRPRTTRWSHTSSPYTEPLAEGANALAQFYRLGPVLLPTLWLLPLRVCLRVPTEGPDGGIRG